MAEDIQEEHLAIILSYRIGEVLCNSPTLNDKESIKYVKESKIWITLLIKYLKARTLVDGWAITHFL